jgi:hypothetical protein
VLLMDGSAAVLGESSLGDSGPTSSTISSLSTPWVLLVLVLLAGLLTWL